jgi:hypothetical protein
MIELQHTHHKICELILDAHKYYLINGNVYVYFVVMTLIYYVKNK